MVASPNYIIGVYDADESTEAASAPVPAGSIETERLYRAYFRSVKQPVVDTAFSGRSDYQAFIENGVAAGGLFSGGDGVKTEEEVALFGGTAGITYDPNYHTPADDISNISRRSLDHHVRRDRAHDDPAGPHHRRRSTPPTTHCRRGAATPRAHPRGSCCAEEPPLATPSTVPRRLRAARHRHARTPPRRARATPARRPRGRCRGRPGPRCRGVRAVPGGRASWNDASSSTRLAAGRRGDQVPAAAVRRLLARQQPVLTEAPDQSRDRRRGDTERVGDLVGGDRCPVHREQQHLELLQGELAGHQRIEAQLGRELVEGAETG